MPRKTCIVSHIALAVSYQHDKMYGNKYIGLYVAFSITCYVYLVHKRLYMVVYVVYMSLRWFLIAMISTVSLSFGVCWVQYVATLSQHKAIGVFARS